MTSSERFDRIDDRTKRGGEGGNPDQWREAAKAMLGLSTQDADLEIFGFTHLPTQLELRRAYKAKMFEHHPDRGGDTNMAARIAEAYANLLKRVKL
jgi:hypothetical protein